MPNRKALEDLSADDIIASILDPEGSPLPEKYEQEKRRVIQASRLWDSYPNERRVAALIRTKYGVSMRQALRDVDLAKRLFKTQHTFDYDAAAAWMIKDQIELIQKCKVAGDLREWNRAKKVLQEVVACLRPTHQEDPSRMQANLFVVNVNSGGHQYEVPLDVVRSMPADQIKTMIDSLAQPIEDAEELEEIFNS